ncbi:hypothetical protein DL764_005031 [Monosporascus ibericus]|uniref:Uncharacterized protein n=1 Tax=Monosporascus ibericus TaxID=155417 RepID=A0A4Q4TAF2_9PEZI|nr:hypothetical protein DL764_005031 [Monosporascus ibericus]
MQMFIHESAAEKGHKKIVQLLFDKGAELDAKDSNSRTPLLWAAENGHKEIVQLLLDEGAKTDTKDNDGRTPLLLAVETEHKEIVQLLLDKGAEVDLKDKDGRMPLSWAAENGHKEIVQLLFDKGAEIDAKENYFGRTPLLWAAEEGHKEMVQLLLDKGAEVDAKDKDGRTPLSKAAEKGHKEMVQLLLDRGAAIEAADKDGRTPLSYAAANRYEAVVRLLLDRGAHVEATDRDGRTPLSHAIEMGHGSVTRLLSMRYPTYPRIDIGLPDPEAIQTGPPTDSGYATATHGKSEQVQSNEDSQRKHTTQGACDQDNLESDNARTEYSVESSHLASEREAYISELADDLISKVCRDQPQGTGQKRPIERISEMFPELMRAFALKIGHSEDQKHRDIMVFVHKHRSTITERFKAMYSRREGDNSHEEENLPDINKDDSKTMTWNERVMRWNPDSGPDNLAPSEEADEEEVTKEGDEKEVTKEGDEEEVTKEGDEEEGDEATASAQDYLGIIYKTTAYQWLLGRLSREFLLVPAKLDIMDNISRKIIESLPSRARTWPSTAKQTLQLVKDVVRSGHGKCDLPDTKLTARIKGLKFIVEASGTRYSLAEIAEELIWLGAAVRSAPQPDEFGVAYCQPSIARLMSDLQPEPGILWDINFKVRRESDCIRSSPGECWFNLFRNPVVVEGYPIPRRPEHGEPDANYYADTSLLESSYDGFRVGEPQRHRGESIVSDRTVAVGKKDRGVPFGRGYLDRLAWLLKRWVVLYDVKDGRGWLVDGVSGLLHLIRSSLADEKSTESTGPLKHLYRFQMREYESGSDRSSHRAFNILENKANRDQKLWEGLSTTFEEMVDGICSTLEWTLECHKIFDKECETLQENLKGFLFVDIAENRDHIRPCWKELLPERSTWQNLTRKLEAVVLVGCGFGELIKPADTEGVCPSWRAVPPSMDYLAVRVSDLKTILRERGSQTTRPWQLIDDVCWVTRDKIFNKCYRRDDLNQSSQSPPVPSFPDGAENLHDIDRAATEATTMSRKPNPSPRTWRVRGVPQDIDRNKLASVLRNHPDIRPDKDIAKSGDDSGNSVSVRTLAPDRRFHKQVATIRFDNLPPQLDALGSKGQLVIEINIASESPPTGAKRKRGSSRAGTLTIDEHFEGITTVFSPSTNEEHQIDVLAVCGLGAHPFGSFVNKGDGNMWLSDNLPEDIPAARVMIYGYESGLQHSTSFAHLSDLASSLQIAISDVLRSEKKRLILIGHSLGGLLIKEALIQIARSDSESDLLNIILGVLLFGAPNDGMEIGSLIPMVNDQPNRRLLETLNTINPQILESQRQNFSKILTRTNLEIFCFYETELSPTAAKVGVF